MPKSADSEVKHKETISDTKVINYSESENKCIYC